MTTESHQQLPIDISQTETPADPDCQEAVFNWLSQVGNQLTVAYEELEGQEPDKLAGNSEKLRYLSQIAMLTGKRELVGDLIEEVSEKPLPEQTTQA